MSELAFCKSFLTALDARPAKLSSDHIADARQYPAQGAVSAPITLTTPVANFLHSTPSLASQTHPTPLAPSPKPPAMPPPLHYPSPSSP
jgi:hypothetical protein